ncbi:hypothetical protein IGI37_001109 [Enterococcus sp. AZ194]|uniref:hypothetical protein n=1 Tax=Enterococcus sp. AZ194 TaxID=2774629 RepID=UPI003F28F099
MKANTKKINTIRNGFLILMTVAFLITLVVDLVINRKPTWSVIVGSSLILLGGIISPLISSKNKRVLRSIAVFSILIIPYFMVIEWVTNTYFLKIPIYWVLPIGLPISCIWIAYLWLNIGIRYLLHWNVGYCLGVGILLAIPAALVTNNLGNQLSLFDSSAMNSVVMISLLVCGIAGFVLGFFIRSRK